MTLLVRNVELLGAERDFPGKVDVFISGDKISAIGDFSKKQADVVVDGQGAYLSPGFIDVNTESDHYFGLFDHPEQTGFLSDGVTSIVGGTRGVSLAPLIYGDLSLLESWTHTTGYNVNWHSMAEFLRVLDRKPLGVNFSTLAGDSTIRDAITGYSSKKLTGGEVGVFKKVLGEALHDGAFGFSADRSGEKLSKIPTSEIKNVLGVMGKSGVYMPHLDPFLSDGFIKGFEESKAIARELGVQTIVEFSLPVVSGGESFGALGEKLKKFVFEKNMHFVISPENDLFSLSSFLPEWLRHDHEGVHAKLRDKWHESRITKDMPLIDPRRFLVVQAPENESFVNKSLAEIQEAFDCKDARDALLIFMKTTKLRAMILYPTDLTLADELLRRPEALIASRGASTLKHGNSYPALGGFMKYLALAEKKGLMPLPKAIHAITAKPAELFGLRDRGIIKEGAIADLVAFKNFEVKFTVVNGTLAWQDGEKKGRASGKVLRGTHAHSGLLSGLRTRSLFSRTT